MTCNYVLPHGDVATMLVRLDQAAAQLGQYRRPAIFVVDVVHVHQCAAGNRFEGQGDSAVID